MTTTLKPAPGGWEVPTKVTLIVENPRLHTRYYVVAQPYYQPPTYVLKDGPPGMPFNARSFLDDDETVDSDDTRTVSSSEESDVPLTVPVKQVRNKQPQCAVRSCSKFCKRGRRFCTKCEEKVTNERERIALERANRN